MNVGRTWVITLLGLAVLGPVLPAEARREGRTAQQEPRRADGAGPVDRQEEGEGAPGPGLFRQLGLSDAQRTALGSLRARHQEAHRELRRQLRDQERELFRAMVAPDALQADIEARQQAVSVLRGRLARARISAFFEARALLTPEQLQRLPEVAARRDADGPPRRPGARPGWQERRGSNGGARP